MLEGDVMPGLLTSIPSNGHDVEWRSLCQTIFEWFHLHANGETSAADLERFLQQVFVESIGKCSPQFVCRLGQDFHESLLKSAAAVAEPGLACIPGMLHL